MKKKEPSPSPTPLKPKQLVFLRSVQEHPEQPFTRIYQKAELTPVQAKRILDVLKNGYVKIREDGFPSGQGRRQSRFLTITDLGKEALKNRRPPAPDAKTPLPLYPPKPMLPLPVPPSEPELPPVGTIMEAGNDPECAHHTHYWKTGPADGPRSLGRCMHCGREKVFANSVDYEDPLEGRGKGIKRG